MATEITSISGHRLTRPLQGRTNYDYLWQTIEEGIEENVLIILGKNQNSVHPFGFSNALTPAIANQEQPAPASGALKDPIDQASKKIRALESAARVLARSQKMRSQLSPEKSEADTTEGFSAAAPANQPSLLSVSCSVGADQFSSFQTPDLQITNPQVQHSTPSAPITARPAAVSSSSPQCSAIPNASPRTYRIMEDLLPSHLKPNSLLSFDGLKPGLAKSKPFCIDSAEKTDQMPNIPAHAQMQSAPSSHWASSLIQDQRSYLANLLLPENPLPKDPAEIADLHSIARRFLGSSFDPILRRTIQSSCKETRLKTAARRSGVAAQKN